MTLFVFLHFLGAKQLLYNFVIPPLNIIVIIIVIICLKIVKL